MLWKESRAPPGRRRSSCRKDLARRRGTDMWKSFIAPMLIAALFTGCTMGPNYHRPAIKTPGTFRASVPIPAGDTVSLADRKWWEAFTDERLQELKRTTLC